jgi:hypothetical protein
MDVYFLPPIEYYSTGGVFLKNTEVVVINIFSSEDLEERNNALKEALIKYLSKELLDN